MPEASRSSTWRKFLDEGERWTKLLRVDLRRQMTADPMADSRPPRKLRHREAAADRARARASCSYRRPSASCLLLPACRIDSILRVEPRGPADRLERRVRLSCVACVIARRASHVREPPRRTGRADPGADGGGGRGKHGGDLRRTGRASGKRQAGVLSAALALSTVVLSWIFIHVIFAFHYAHEFYGEAEGRQQRRAEVSRRRPSPNTGTSSISRS